MKGRSGIENITLFFIVLLLCVICFFIIQKREINNQIIHNQVFEEREDVLLNPYTPPLRDERYFGGRVPINISTNVGAVDTAYRQVGLLTPVQRHGHGHGQVKILPLMGRPLFTSRDKWQYYSMSDQNNSVKLPIIFKNRNATNENGVDKIYNRDIVYVEGYNEAFRVTEYENDTIRYLPFL